MLENEKHSDYIPESRASAFAELKYYWRTLAVYIAIFGCIILNFFAGYDRASYLKHKGLLAATIAILIMGTLLYYNRTRYFNRTSYRAAMCSALLIVSQSCFFIFGLFNKATLLVTACVMSPITIWWFRRLSSKDWNWIEKYTLACLVPTYVLCIVFCLRYVYGIRGVFDDYCLVLLPFLAFPIMMTGSISLIRDAKRQMGAGFEGEMTDYQLEENDTFKEDR